MLLTAVGPVHAQDTTEAVTKEAATEEAAEEAKAEKVEASSNLREAIHENLETIQEDAQSVEELRDTKAADSPTEQQQPAEPDDKPELQTDGSSEPPPEKKSILDHLKSLPGLLQSVPERVPFFRDRGLIFFGRTEITGRGMHRTEVQMRPSPVRPPVLRSPVLA